MNFRDFQDRVYRWICKCFSKEIAQDTQERSHRFLEEALELVQSTGTTKEEALILVDYVFARPVGETYQEIGGVLVTLAGLASCVNEDLDFSGRTELERIEHPHIMDKIRLKQSTKPQNSPLPSS